LYAALSQVVDLRKRTAYLTLRNMFLSDRRETPLLLKLNHSYRHLL
jgi:hypothetical protein